MPTALPFDFILLSQDWYSANLSTFLPHSAFTRLVQCQPLYLSTSFCFHKTGTVPTSLPFYLILLSKDWYSANLSTFRLHSAFTRLVQCQPLYLSTSFCFHKTGTVPTSLPFDFILLSQDWYSANLSPFQLHSAFTRLVQCQPLYLSSSFCFHKTGTVPTSLPFYFILLSHDWYRANLSTFLLQSAFKRRVQCQPLYLSTSFCFHKTGTVPTSLPFYLILLSQDWYSANLSTFLLHSAFTRLVQCQPQCQPLYLSTSLCFHKTGTVPTSLPFYFILLSHDWYSANLSTFLPHFAFTRLVQCQHLYLSTSFCFHKTGTVPTSLPFYLILLSQDWYSANLSTFLPHSAFTRLVQCQPLYLSTSICFHKTGTVPTSLPFYFILLSQDWYSANLSTFLLRSAFTRLVQCQPLYLSTSFCFHKTGTVPTSLPFYFILLSQDWYSANLSTFLLHSALTRLVQCQPLYLSTSFCFHKTGKVPTSLPFYFILLSQDWYSANLSTFLLHSAFTRLVQCQPLYLSTSFCFHKTGTVPTSLPFYFILLSQDWYSANLSTFLLHSALTRLVQCQPLYLSTSFCSHKTGTVPTSLPFDFILLSQDWYSANLSTFRLHSAFTRLVQCQPLYLSTSFCFHKTGTVPTSLPFYLILLSQDWYSANLSTFRLHSAFTRLVQCQPLYLSTSFCFHKTGTVPTSLPFDFILLSQDWYSANLSTFRLHSAFTRLVQCQPLYLSTSFCFHKTGTVPTSLPFDFILLSQDWYSANLSTFRLYSAFTRLVQCQPLYLSTSFCFHMTGTVPTSLPFDFILLSQDWYSANLSAFLPHSALTRLVQCQPLYLSTSFISHKTGTVPTSLPFDFIHHSQDWYSANLSTFLPHSAFTWLVQCQPLYLSTSFCFHTIGTLPTSVPFYFILLSQDWYSANLSTFLPHSAFTRLVQYQPLYLSTSFCSHKTGTVPTSLPFLFILLSQDWYSSNLSTFLLHSAFTRLVPCQPLYLSTSFCFHKTGSVPTSLPFYFILLSQDWYSANLSTFLPHSAFTRLVQCQPLYLSSSFCFHKTGTVQPLYLSTSFCFHKTGTVPTSLPFYFILLSQDWYSANLSTFLLHSAFTRLVQCQPLYLSTSFCVHTTGTVPTSLPFYFILLSHDWYIANLSTFLLHSAFTRLVQCQPLYLSTSFCFHKTGTVPTSLPFYLILLSQDWYSANLPTFLPHSSFTRLVQSQPLYLSTSFCFHKTGTVPTSLPFYFILLSQDWYSANLSTFRLHSAFTRLVQCQPLYLSTSFCFHKTGTVPTSLPFYLILLSQDWYSANLSTFLPHSAFTRLVQCQPLYLSTSFCFHKTGTVPTSLPFYLILLSQDWYSANLSTFLPHSAFTRLVQCQPLYLSTSFCFHKTGTVPTSLPFYLILLSQDWYSANLSTFLPRSAFTRLVQCQHLYLSTSFCFHKTGTVPPSLPFYFVLLSQDWYSTTLSTFLLRSAFTRLVQCQPLYLSTSFCFHKTGTVPTSLPFDFLLLSQDWYSANLSTFLLHSAFTRLVQCQPLYLSTSFCFHKTGTVPTSLPFDFILLSHDWYSANLSTFRLHSAFTRLVQCQPLYLSTSFCFHKTGTVPTSLPFYFILLSQDWYSANLSTFLLHSAFTRLVQCQPLYLSTSFCSHMTGTVPTSLPFDFILLSQDWYSANLSTFLLHSAFTRLVQCQPLYLSTSFCFHKTGTVPTSLPFDFILLSQDWYNANSKHLTIVCFSTLEPSQRNPSFFWYRSHFWL